MKFIVDTSVAVKWFVAEEGRSDARLLLRDDIYRVTLDLMFVEAANALRKKIKLAEIDAKHADRALNEMLGGFFEDIVPAQKIICEALTLAHKMDHPVPDCCFLALALSLDLRLVTADNRFVERCSSFPAQVVRLSNLAHTLDQ